VSLAHHRFAIVSKLVRTLFPNAFVAFVNAIADAFLSSFVKANQSTLTVRRQWKRILNVCEVSIM